MNASDLWNNRPPWNDDIPDDAKWRYIRKHRNDLLVKSDWSQIEDSPLTGTTKQSWKDYRRLLRDIPQTYASPNDVVFPDLPAGGLTVIIAAPGKSKSS